MTAVSGVRVWMLDLALWGAALREEERKTPRLAPSELARAASFAGRPDGERWLAVRTALRLLLEEFAGPRIRGQPFAVAPGGKPGLPASVAAPVAFSVSHSGERALLAIGGGPVGVDLEQERRLLVGRSRAAGLEAAAEALAAAGGAAGRASTESENPALRAWVRLEAYAKARGSGIGRLLQELALNKPAGRQSPQRAAELAAALRSQEGLSVQDLELGRGLHGAVACRDGEAVVVRDFAEGKRLGT